MRSQLAVITCAIAIRIRSSAAATGVTSKLPTETIRPSEATTIGLSPEALSSVSSCMRAWPSASRAAPSTCGSVRKLSGSCRFRGAPGCHR